MFVTLRGVTTSASAARRDVEEIASSAAGASRRSRAGISRKENAVATASDAAGACTGRLLFNYM
jgi:hypothetical protein